MLHNYDLLKELVGKLSRSGKEAIQCVCDFDGTLTVFEGPSGLSNTVIGQIKNSGILGKEYEEECEKLFRFYNDVEFKKSFSDYEKSVFMTGWRHQHILLFNRYGLNATKLKQIALSNKLTFRTGCIDFLQFLHHHNIPVTILSAAYENLIKYYLDNENCLFSETHIVSNSNNTATIVINNFNKKEIDLHDYSLGDDVLFRRKNVLLLGDTINDSFIAESLRYETIVRIGFVKNENDIDRIKKMNKYYDIVLYDNFDYGVLKSALEGELK